MAIRFARRLSRVNHSGTNCLSPICSSKATRTIYLQVDIVAGDVNDLRAWKGWVESQLIKLTLMIERDTYGQLQCHEYVDSSKHCSHSAFFMGLQRKEGEIKGKRFDLRVAVEEFRYSVNMYLYWKPKMDLYVSHVGREQIPSYVFRDGYKRSRDLRQQGEQSCHVDEGCSSESATKQPKKELADANAQGRVEKCEYSASPQKHDS